MKFKRRNCKICQKPAMQNRAICWTCELSNRRKKREDKLAKQAVSKAKKKARHEQSESYRKVLFKKAWKLWSEYVRCVSRPEVKTVYCFTCSKPMNPKEAHAGHFHHNKLDFDWRNVHPQCPGCNTYKHGNLAIYAERLIEEGIDLKQLRRDAEIKGNAYSIKELHEIIEKFSK